MDYREYGKLVSKMNLYGQAESIQLGISCFVQSVSLESESTPLWITTLRNRFK